MKFADPTFAEPVVVLLVEEDLILNFFFCEFLKEAGFKVFDVTTTKEAQIALQTQPGIKAAVVKITSVGPVSDVTFADLIAVQYPHLALFVIADQIPSTVQLPPRATVLTPPYDPSLVTTFIRQAVDERNSIPTSTILGGDTSDDVQPSLLHQKMDEAKKRDPSPSK